jgi:hypothetical protein
VVTPPPGLAPAHAKSQASAGRVYPATATANRAGSGRALPRQRTPIRPMGPWDQATSEEYALASPCLTTLVSPEIPRGTGSAIVTRCMSLG